METQDSFVKKFEKIVETEEKYVIENLTAYAVQNDNGWYNEDEMDEFHSYYNRKYYISKTKAQEKADELQKKADDDGYNDNPKESWDNYEVVKITIIV